jgi:hypothetical protein
VTEADWRAELGTRTTEILGRFGVAGRVEVESQLVWLIGHGPTVEVRLSESDLAMAALGSTQQKPIAERLARELARARRKAAGDAGSASSWAQWAKLIPPLALTSLGIWAAFHYLAPRGAADVRSLSAKGARLNRGLQSPAKQVPERQALDDQSCLRTVTRIQQGGTVSPLDTDGWVVELALLSERDNLNPAATALNDYFPLQAGSIERTHHGPNTPLLNDTQGESAGVLISKDPLGLSGIRGSGISITWRGKYVARYFDPTERAEYISVANALFADVNASYGALYARCVQGAARYLGTWFRGPTVGGALWMLVAEMEVVSGSVSVPGLNAGSEPDVWSAPLSQLADKLQNVSRKRAALVLANSGGTVSERPGQSATVEFPFSPANRANLAAATIARRVWPSADAVTPVHPAAP